MDNLTKEQRIKCMSSIRSKNTQPEKVIRKTLTKMGWKYRLHVNKLPGNPDIVISRKKTIIFINGCFWHQHKGCKRKSMPKTNMNYWKPKLKKNIQRQIDNIKRLKKAGWKVGIIWECQTRNGEYLIKRIKKILA